jgi:lysophospholipase L1-like esterase
MLKEKLYQCCYYLTTVLIMPLLLIQAVWVRLTVLKLPEPCGDRSGQCGDGDKLKLLVLGDSAAAGVGVTKQKDAIAGQLSASLAVNHQVNWRLVASNGFTSSDLIRELSQLSSQTFDYVLISVGVNDITSLTRSYHWRANIEAIVEVLKVKFDAPKIMFSSIPPMQLFKAIPFPLNWWLGKRARKLNKLMIRALECREKNTVLKFDLPFKPEFLAKDGIHPSGLAYDIWAQQVKVKIHENIK